MLVCIRSEVASPFFREPVFWGMLRSHYTDTLHVVIRVVSQDLMTVANMLKDKDRLDVLLDALRSPKLSNVLKTVVQAKNDPNTKKKNKRMGINLRGKDAIVVLNEFPRILKAVIEAEDVDFDDSQLVILGLVWTSEEFLARYTYLVRQTKHLLKHDDDELVELEKEGERLLRVLGLTFGGFATPYKIRLYFEFTKHLQALQKDLVDERKHGKIFAIHSRAQGGEHEFQPFKRGFAHHSNHRTGEVLRIMQKTRQGRTVGLLYETWDPARVGKTCELAHIECRNGYDKRPLPDRFRQVLSMVEEIQGVFSCVLRW